MTNPDPFRRALARVLRPLVLAMIARGIGFPVLTELLKRLYVEVAERRFGLAWRRMTDSRISLLTGLQRKDVRAQRAALMFDGGSDGAGGAGPLPRIIARWQAGPPFADKRGRPRALPRADDVGPSFESLAASVSRDLHPRTMLDELVRLDLIRLDTDTDEVSLLAPAFLPGRDEAALAEYFGANLGDHASAAVENILVAPEPGPFFERAVHYNQLTPEALDELEVLARDLQGKVFATLNRRALELQGRDDGVPSAAGRFRCGAFIYRLDEEEPDR